MKPTTNKGLDAMVALVLFAVLGLAVLSLAASQAGAAPEGPLIVSHSNSTKNATNGTVHIAGKGTINTVLLSSQAQNNRWKAYVGNVTGSLVLQDSGGFNIYDWTLSSALSGNVIASRNISLDWSSLNCMNQSTIAIEQSVGQLDFSPTGSDNINNTFTATNHTTFVIGGTTLNRCYTVYTFQNSTRQGANDSANIFQEIAIMDRFNATGYATRIHSDPYGYNNFSRVDFQLLIPDYGNLTRTETATYYFFVELT